MDLEQRLKQLEGFHDWHGVVEALEQGVLSAEDAAKKAEYHLRLGRLLYSQFLQGVRALKLGPVRALSVEEAIGE